jgi:alpha-D-xyloside xylohydrolase
MMRPLVFDYPDDEGVFDIKDQVLFGPAVLVNPVTRAGATSRDVYLPGGTWYDFWTGSAVDGGGVRSVAAPLSQIPLFVRAGSIVPMGPMIQYATESADPLELRIYEGADASFTLYEDAGDGYAYEGGEHATVSLTWNQARQSSPSAPARGATRGCPRRAPSTSSGFRRTTAAESPSPRRPTPS